MTISLCSCGTEEAKKNQTPVPTDFQDSVVRGAAAASYLGQAAHVGHLAVLTAPTVQTHKIVLGEGELGRGEDQPKPLGFPRAGGGI